MVKNNPFARVAALLVVALAVLASGCGNNPAAPEDVSPPPVQKPADPPPVARVQIGVQAFTNLRMVSQGDNGFGLTFTGPGNLPMTVSSGELEIRVETREPGARVRITLGFAADLQRVAGIVGLQKLGAPRGITFSADHKFVVVGNNLLDVVWGTGDSDVQVDTDSTGVAMNLFTLKGGCNIVSIQNFRSKEALEGKAIAKK
jgi:hypothetical protein